MRPTITTRHGRLATGLLLAPLCFAVACADSRDEGPPTSAQAEPMSREERLELRRQLQADQIPDPARLPAPDDAAVTGEVPQEMIDAILGDMVAQTGAERAALAVVQSEAKQWSSGALGCPEPGQMYTQAIVDGYKVVITYNGDRYDYRATTDGYFKLCPGVDSPRM